MAPTASRRTLRNMPNKTIVSVNGVGAWLLIWVHHGGEAPDPESPPMKYPKRSQYKYAKSRYRVRNWHEESHPRGTTGGGAARVQDSQHDDPSRDARQLPSGVTLSRGTGEPALSSEPCNNAHLRTRFRESRRASEKTKAYQFLPVGTPVPGRWLCPRTSAGAKAGGWRSWTSFPMAGPAPCADYPKKV